jgi:hypothetical protein
MEYKLSDTAKTFALAAAFVHKVRSQPETSLPRPAFQHLVVFFIFLLAEKIHISFVVNKN